jgi:hypothetical protein
MAPCKLVDSCSLVNSLTQDFPTALKILRQRYCDGDYLRCSRYLRCEGGNCDTIMYADVAQVVGLIESCMNGIAEQWGVNIYGFNTLIRRELT